jgi:HD domain
LAVILKANDIWQLEMAALLSQIGCVTVPESVLSKVYEGSELTAQERDMFERHPSIGGALIAKIPRLEAVGEIIACQETHFEDRASAAGGKSGNGLPLGARILKVSLDYDSLESQDHGTFDVVKTLAARAGWYDPAVLAAAQAVAVAKARLIRKDLTIAEVRPGMVLGENLLHASGMVLLTQGQEITETLLQRLENFRAQNRIKDPITVLVADDSL